MDVSRPHPPFDPELAAVLDALPAGMKRPLNLETVAADRSWSEGAVPDELLRRDGAVDVEERRVPGPTGAPDVSALILRPAGLARPVPGIYHVHGGGMVMGDNRTGIVDLVDLVVDRGVVVVSVEYRLAPEHPHPAPVEDCYAGLVWTAQHAAELNIDPARLLIYGASAGGGLSAATALLARDRGGPALSHQILLCPMLDDRGITASSQELDNEGIWDRNANRTGWTALLGDARGGPDVAPYAAPARAADLSHLPATFIDVGAVETFRDETIDYAARLARAGVSVELHVWAGAFHGFETFAPQAAVSRDSRAARLGYLRRALGV
ncbi:alpha/beta hydrolase [Actinoplanes subtropicus]|uniref:alpha/beta hydrolase n=1 Tax=Actinoplanes subtropicus TaxID=543632 RepID=UPI0004C47978|nr:alpha/beta hydrolase [Actinoplanes subtropicus]